MNKNKKILLSIALISAILFVIGFATDDLILRLITKPIPVVIFALLLPRKTKFQKLIFYGFLFSIAGDILLELPYDLFMFGLLAFLLAHVSYILSFLERSKSLEIEAFIILLIIGAGILYFIFPGLGNMKIAVIIYMLVILTMVWRAFAQRKADKYAIVAFWGAVFFLFSDTNIAIDKFFSHQLWERYVIIISYWIGQYLIFTGATKSTEA